MTVDALAALIRPEIRDGPDYNAGISLEKIRAELGMARIVKLDSNEVTHRPSPAVLRALASLGDELFRYPDREELRLRRMIGDDLDIAPDRLAFAAGSEDLIGLLFRAVLRRGDVVATTAPAFGLYEIAAVQNGARAERVAFPPDWSFPVEALSRVLADRPRVLIVSSPCNPTGGRLLPDELERLLAAAGSETLVVLDEAYAEFLLAEERDQALRRLERHPGPWIVLRTFSKAYGLAGLRIGYGVASHADLAGAIYRLRSPFNVSAAALAAAEAVYPDQTRLAEVRGAIESERARLAAALRARGYAPAPATANFLFFDCGRSAVDLALDLRRQGVLVKPWREPGWERFVRVTVGEPDETDAFLAALPAAPV